MAVNQTSKNYHIKTTSLRSKDSKPHVKTMDELHTWSTHKFFFFFYLFFIFTFYFFFFFKSMVEIEFSESVVFDNQTRSHQTICKKNLKPKHSKIKWSVYMTVYLSSSRKTNQHRQSQGRSRSHSSSSQ